MIRDITIGQYYPQQSVIHSLDPRVKLLGTIVFIVSVFMMKNIIGFLLVTGVMTVLIKMSRVPLKFMLKGLKSIFFIMLLTFGFSLFLTDGEIIWQFWILKITREGFVNGILMIIRLSYLIVGSSLMTLTTTPNQLADGMEKGLGFLTKIHVPVHEIAMMMTIALRFIPILMEEMDKIMKAQKARGADFESGNLIERAKSLVPVLVPLFISSIRRAGDLAMAMEARCYNGGQGRTRLKPLKYNRKDYTAYISMFVYIAAVILIKQYAGMTFM